MVYTTKNYICLSHSENHTFHKVPPWFWASARNGERQLVHCHTICHSQCINSLVWSLTCQQLPQQHTIAATTPKYDQGNLMVHRLLTDDVSTVSNVATGWEYTDIISAYFTTISQNLWELCPLSCAFKNEVMCYSRTLVTTYKTTKHHNPEDHNPHCDNPEYAWVRL
jgi:hypothetical protein